MNLPFGVVSIFAGLVVGFLAFNTPAVITPLGEDTGSPKVLATVESSPASPTPDLEESTQSPTDVLATATVQPLLTPTPTPLATPHSSPVATPIPLSTPSPSLQPTSTPIPTPTPKPSATPAPSPTWATAAQIDGWFSEFAGSYGVSVDLLRKIAVCESGYNQFARNGIYGGMFQFSPNTWQSTRNAMSMDPDPNLRFDAREAIRTAAYRISKVGTAAWPNCS